MHQIFLDDVAMRVEDIEYPCIIHGKQGSGASQFTISLAAQLVLSGSKTIFFSAFPQGKKNFLSQLGGSYRKDKVIIPESGNEKEFLEMLDRLAHEQIYIVVKNIERYGEEFLERVLSNKRLVLSGDFDLCSNVSSLLLKSRTQIVFSPSTKITLDQTLPKLQKYEGFLVSSSVSGKVRLGLE